MLVLALTGGLGINNYIVERMDTLTPLQWSVAYGVLGYGVFGAVSALGLLRRSRWSLWTALAWAGLCTYAAGTAVLAYGGSDASLSGALSAYAAAGIVTAGVVWAVRTVTK
jgi:hypothetical protein